MSTGFQETTLRDLYHSHCAVLGVKPNSVLSRQLAGESGEGLTTLDVSKNYLGERGFQAFLQVVAEASELVTLRLTGNGLTNDAVASLCRVAGDHPTLRVIDLSNNPLSLPAATAVVALLRKNVRLVSVVVAETFIEDRAKLKIARALDRNQRLLTKAKAHEADRLNAAAAAAAAASAAAPGGGAAAVPETPYEKVRREHEVRAAAAKAARVEGAGHAEETISMHMRRRVPVAPSRGSDGWVVLGVWVSSTPTDFHTELQTIHRSVLPRMNAALRKRKVLLVPYSAHHEAMKAKVVEKKPHFTLAADGGAQAPPPTYETPNCKLFSDDDTILSERLHLIDLCSPLFVMLVGDKHGPVPRFVPAYYAAKPVFCDGFGVGNGVNTSATMAQIESGYGGHSLLGGGGGGGDRQSSKPSLFFMRECCRCLNVPEGLMEAMTDDCAYLHVDSEGKMRPGLLECVTRDLYEKGKTRWEGWVAHKKTLQANVPPAMVMARYRSTFDTVNARGQILLKGQDGFARAFESRLGEVVDFLYPEEEEGGGKEEGRADAAAVVPFNECYQRRREYLEHIVESSATSGRNNSISKLELHLISPTSRNMLLVTGSRHAGIGSVMALFVRKLLNKSAYAVASAVVGHASICEDSHSLRTLLLSLSSQILRCRAADATATGASPSPPPCVPPHIVNEVRTSVLREYFKGVLADAAAALPDGRLLVIVVDGLEKVRYPPEPEASLLKTEGGKNVLELDGQMLAASPGGRLGVGIVGGSGGGGGSGAPSDHLDWIPKCLPKNVRLIASCEEGGATAGAETARRLLQRGQDCCEALEVLPPGVHEAEKAVRSALAQRRVRLSDELYYDYVMKKPCITDVVYRDLLAAHIVQRYERGPESTPKAFLEAVPEDLDGLVSRMLDYAEGVSTPALVRKCLTALALVPDGLRLFEMRELLGGRAAGVHLLSGRDLELLLHGVRPFLARFLTGHKDYGPLVSVTPEAQAGEEPQQAAAAAAEEEDEEEGGAAPSNGTLHRLQLSCGPVREMILARYAASPEEKADAYAVLGRFFYALSELEDHPSTVLGLVSYPGCMLQAGMWGTVMRYFFSISTVRRYFMHTVGYTMYNYMVDAHRVIHARLKELRIGGAAAAAPPGAKHDRHHTVEELDVWLHKVKEYTHFVVLNVTSLSTKPSLSIQQGLLMHDGSTVCVEAAQYCEQHPQEAHFVCVNKTSLRMGRGTVASVAFSPNGLRLLACHEKSFTLTNTMGAVLHHYNASFTVVMGVVSPTSRYAAVVLVDKSILVYDAVTGACVAKLAGHTGRIRACVFTARSGYVVSGGDDGCVRVWDSESGRVVATLCHRQFLCVTSSHASVAAVATHPTDERLFMSAIDRTVLVWCRDCLEHTLRHKVIAHTSFPVKRLLWLFDGDCFLVQCKMPMRGSTAEPCQESCLRLYDGATAELKVRFEGAEHSCINDVAVGPSERLLAAALDDGTLVFWDLAAAVTAGGSARPIAVIRAFSGSASRVVFYVHPAAAATAAEEDGEAVPCAADDDGPLPRQRLEGSGSAVLCAVTGDSNLLKVYNTETHALELEHVSHSSVADLAATPAPTAEGARLAVGDSTGRLYLLTERALATRQ